MSGLHIHIKENKFLNNVFSDIDKRLLREYNIPYCTYDENEIFFIIVSDDVEEKEVWHEVKSRCIDNGIDFDFVVIREDEYKKWVHDLFPTYKILENGYFSINDR